MGNALPVSMPAAVKLSQAPNLRDEYYGQCNLLKGPEDFTEVLYFQRPGGFAPILKSLMPEGIAMGSTTQEVLDRMGTPNYVLSNDRNINGHQVIFFRKDLSPFLVSLQFHMYRGRLVYAQSRFIDTEDTRGTMHEVLLAIIRRNTGAEKGEFAFQDGQGNRLWVE